MSPKQGRPFEEKSKSGRLEIRISPEEEKILDYCVECTGEKRAEIVRRGIKELYQSLRKEQGLFDDSLFDLKVSISCPHCDCNNRIVVSDYEVDCIVNDRGENGMGDEVEHIIECEDFICAACNNVFTFEGTVSEYPVGAINYKNYSVTKK